MKIVLAQNYSLGGLEHLTARYERPRHHLWGLDGLREIGADAVSPVYRDRPLLSRLTKLTKHAMGNLARQRSLFETVHSHQPDVIVCSETSFARGFSILRRLRVLRTPLVGVAHPFEPRRSWARWAFGGFDQVMCLSVKIRDHLVEAGFPADRISVATWGPDLGFPGYVARDDGAVVSTGRTHRDLDLLIRALGDVGAPGVVHTARPIETDSRVELRLDVPYAQVLDDLCSARIVAIPLSRTDGCFGITELNDALALGKPILMTRNPYIDVDLEGIGCGEWIEPGDESGWVASIRRLTDNPERAAAMGRRGRAWAETNWNYDLYCRELVAAVERAAR